MMMLTKVVGGAAAAAGVAAGVAIERQSHTTYVGAKAQYEQDMADLKSGAKDADDFPFDQPHDPDRYPLWFGAGFLGGAVAPTFGGMLGMASMAQPGSRLMAAGGAAIAAAGVGLLAGVIASNASH